MKRKIFLPLVMLLVILAGCTLGDVNPLKEDLVAPTAMPTNTPVPKENFESSLYDDFSTVNPAWLDTHTVTTSAVPGSMLSKVDVKAGKMVFDIQEAETYLYKFFKNPARQDVVIEAKVQGNGAQVNGMSLICRAKNDFTAWYEFRVSDEGRYFVYRYEQSRKDNNDENPYVELAKGNLAKDVFSPFKENTLKVTCQGNTLSLVVNDKPVVSLEDGVLAEAGLVGAGGMSYSLLPVIVNFDYLSYGQP